MNKTELIAVAAEKAQLQKKDVAAAVDAVMEVVTQTLSNGEKVTIPGFGTFETRESKARMVNNMHTGEKMEIPAAVRPVFKAGKGLKDAVKSKE